MKSILCWGLLMIGLQGYTQQMLHLDSLRETRSFPETIMTERSAVIMNLPYEDYKPLSEIAHKSLRRAGIDAVAYFYYQDLFAGLDVTPSFVEDLIARKVSNIIYVNQYDDGLYRVVVSSFTGDFRFIDPSAQNWTIRGRDFEYLFTSLYREAANSKLDNTNHMIIDTPEFYTDTNLIRGTRRESKYLNLNVQKLAVPYFKGHDLEAQEMNRRLKELFTDYPFEVEFVDPDADPLQLRKDLNCQVILRYIHTTQKSAMQMLDYSQILPSEKLIYKFYLKHIYTGNIFLGERWDASASWEKAIVDYFDEL